MLDLLLENWEVIGSFLAVILGILGLTKYVSKIKFLAVWNALDDVILALIANKEVINTVNVKQQLKIDADFDEKAKKAYKIVDKSPRNTEKIVSNFIKARSLMKDVNEVKQTAKSAYKIFKGFKKLF